MKTVMKKMFSLMLVAVLLIGAMPFQAFATETASCEFCDGTGEHCPVCGTCIEGLEGGCPNVCLPAPAQPAQPAVPNEPAAAAAANNGAAPNTYVVTVVRAAGVEHVNNTVTPGSNLYAIIGALVPVAPMREGYTFSGWADTENAAVSNITAETTVDKDITVYPVWELNPIIPEDPGPAAPQTKVLTADLNYTDAPADAKYDVAVGSKLADVVLNVTIPVREGYQFVGWSLAGNIAIADQVVTDDMTIFANWAASSINNNQGGTSSDICTVTYDPNYNTTPATTITVQNGTPVYGTYVPTRYGYTFDGWYEDEFLVYRVKTDATITKSATYYAKWSQNTPYEVFVKFYINGNTTTVAKYVDLFKYAQDMVITNDDLTAAANEHFKAGNTAGLTVYGPFTANDWDRYCVENNYANSTMKVYTNDNEKTVIYAMVHNVKVNNAVNSGSGAVADSTNPKTGDMIFMPAIVLGLSASALAVMFYLNKKRAY